MNGRSPGSPELAAVLAAYPPDLVADLDWQLITTGFSSARVFAGSVRGQDWQPRFALKGWPPDRSRRSLQQIHLWMHIARRHGLPVPALIPARDGQTLVGRADRYWELSQWMPGRPIRTPPTDEALLAAANVLARLHHTWGNLHPDEQHPGEQHPDEQHPGEQHPGEQLRVEYCPFPAAVRRHEALATLPPLPAHLQRWAEWVRAEVAVLATHVVPVHPCLTDVHPDHILFDFETGCAVTGVIDFGAMKLDHPAADVARYFGPLVGDDHERLQLVVAGYQAAGGRTDVTLPLVQRLHAASVLAAIGHWQRHARTTSQQERLADWLRQAALLSQIHRLF